MANPRQRRKQKSSLPKVRPKSRPKLTDPKGNAVIAKNWDKKLTLVQNYRKLGLTSRLNTRTGGVEKTTSQLADVNNIAPKQDDPLAISSSFSKTTVDPEEVQVERDPDTGAILRITDPSWKRDNPLNDPITDLEDRNRATNNEGNKTTTDFVRSLEMQAANEAPAKIRPQSRIEQDWLRQLVDKHGDDYCMMMLDRKLNVYQLSEGDIKRRIRKWRASQVEG